MMFRNLSKLFETKTARFGGLAEKQAKSVLERDFQYICNVCGSKSISKMNELNREEPSCVSCGSTVRMRSIVHLLSIELFGRSVTLCEFPRRRDLVGIGMSDWDGYANTLSKKFAYKNTFYHREPRLDITAIDSALEGKADFIISSDVLEHVALPVSRAFENIARLLKTDGVLILTVPYKKEGQTVEHFPELFDFNVAQSQEGEWIMENKTRDGRMQIFRKLIFHGGEGETLEMRVFSEESLIEELKKAGFRDIKIASEPYLGFGIYWEYDWSLPIVARR